MNDVIDNTSNIVEVKTVFFRAKLDAVGVYQGVEQVDVLSDTDIEVPENCDLPAGEYIWMNGTFIHAKTLMATMQTKAGA